MTIIGRVKDQKAITLDQGIIVWTFRTVLKGATLEAANRLLFESNRGDSIALVSRLRLC